MNAKVESSRALMLRCSSLPLVFGCPGSVVLPDVQIREDSPAADAGTAVHELLSDLVLTGQAPWDLVPAVSEKHGADPDEVRMLLACGAKLWKQVESSFVNARTEVEGALALDGIELTGHMDAVAIAVRSARVLDWKTGRKDSDYAPQLRGYAALIFAAWPELDEVTSTAAWVRDQEIENYTITRAQNDWWLNSLRSRLLDWNGVYHPGQRCLYCPRSHECPGRAALIRREVSSLEENKIDFTAMTATNVIELYERAQMVGKIAERVREVIKQHVKALGDVVASDGRRLTVSEEPRRELDPLAAWPVLEGAGFTDEDFAECVRLGISKVEKRVAEKAGRGKGAGAVRALNESLAAANAVNVKTTERLVTRRG